MKLLLKIFLLFLFLTPTYALSPENRLPDQKLEERAMKLFLEVRCLVCNGQVIENSDSEFSFEMRKLIRGKIAEGKSDEEIKTELIEEFGSDILTTSNSSKLIIITLIIAVLALLLIIIKKC